MKIGHLGHASVLKIAADFAKKTGQSLSQIFEEMDTSGDGLLSIDELHAGFQKLGLHLTKEHITRIVKEVDQDLDGLVDYLEFTGAVNVSAAEDNLEARLLDHVEGRFMDKSIAEYLKALLHASRYMTAEMLIGDNVDMGKFIGALRKDGLSFKRSELSEMLSRLEVSTFPTAKGPSFSVSLLAERLDEKRLERERRAKLGLEDTTAMVLAARKQHSQPRFTAAMREYVQRKRNEPVSVKSEGKNSGKYDMSCHLKRLSYSLL